MNNRILIPLAGLLALAVVAPARAEGRWSLGLLAGESVSQNHGTALDARVLAQVNPELGLGIETGVAYMNQTFRPVLSIATSVGNPGEALASLTDGVTRNCGGYLGPAVKVGNMLYAVASTGIYEFSDNAGHALGTRWGASAGVGLSGRSRFAPTAELRYRWAQADANTGEASGANAVIFAMGFQFH